MARKGFTKLEFLNVKAIIMSCTPVMRIRTMFFPPYSKTSDSEEDTYDLEFRSHSACNSNSNRNEEEHQGSSIFEEPAIIAATMPHVQSTQQRRPLWKHVDSYDEQSRLNFPWRGSVPQSKEIKQPFDYFQYFFCEEVMAFIVKQSNLFAVQCDPGKLLHVTQIELESNL